MSRLGDEVLWFHRKMGQVDPTIPVSDPSPEARQLRARIEGEEYAERIVALVGGLNAAHCLGDAIYRVVKKRGHVDHGDLVELADSSSDCRVVAYGVDLAFGIDSDPIDREVMRANLAKVGGGKDEFGKFLKPPGWTPPAIEALLVAQGWVRK